MSRDGADAKKTKTQIARMTWQEAEDFFSEDPVVLLPVGSLEQNGPQNPLGTDTILAQHFADEVAERVGGGILPPISYGVSQSFHGFRGTVWVRPDTLFRQLRDVMEAVAAHGARTLLVINGHGPNAPLIEHAVRGAALHERMRVASVWPGQILGALATEGGQFAKDARGHGGEPTTSVMLALAPDDVRLDLAVADQPRSRFGVQVVNSFTGQFEGRPVTMYSDMHTVNPTGVTGHAGDAHAEKARPLLEQLVEWGAAFTTQLHAGADY